MRVYYSSFYPLCSTPLGRRAVQRYGIPPFIDGSCRREPDFQHQFPSITALCRPRFVEKLSIGSKVIYSTNKYGIGKKRIVAILEVIEICDSHQEAAQWYRNNSQEVLPNNIMSDENDNPTIPIPLDRTHQMGAWIKWTTGDDWDKEYKKRANEHSTVAICKVWQNHKYLSNPPTITIEEIENIIGHRTLTMNPPDVTTHWDKICALLSNRLTTNNN